MPVVSKTQHPITGDRTFVRIISVDAGGQFKCNLPAAVERVVGQSHVVGTTKAEVERAFSAALKTWRESSTRESTVILWRIDGDFGASFRTGITLNLCASVFKETVVTSNGSETRDFDEIGNTLPEELRRGAHEIERLGRYGKSNVCRMEWTPEREAFFAKLGASMQAVAEVLRTLDDVEYAMRCADTGSLLLSLDRPQLERGSIPQMMQDGKTYRINHRRFGRATVRSLSFDGEFYRAEIVAGTLRGMIETWGPGDIKELRGEQIASAEEVTP